MAAMPVKKIKMPMQAAIIDIGAHSARMDIIQIEKDKSYQILESLVQAVNLGRDVFSRGMISPDSTSLLCGIMKDFAAKTVEYGVGYIRAFATSAVREAFNREIFINNIKIASGIDLEILEGSKEAALITMAVKKALGGKTALAKANLLLMGIGTGSVEVSLVRNGELKFAETFALGTIRIFEEYGNKAAEPERLTDIIDSYTDLIADRISRISDIPQNTKFAAVGESIRIIMDMNGKSVKNEPVRTITQDKFEKLFRKINLMSRTEMAEKYQISDVAARGIVPCAWIIKRFFDMTKAASLIVPAVTTRNAVLEDIIRQLFNEKDPFIPDMLSVVKSMGKKYCFESDHVEAIREISGKIFDKMHAIHSLGERERLYLEIAAILHDIGRFVDSRKHHKHSCYLISNTQIPGLTEEERLVVAAVARYHRKGKPQASHPEYMTLSAPMRVLVCKLASILRVSDAVAHSQKRKTKNCSMTVKDRVLSIKMHGPVDMGLEKTLLSRKADLFEDVYGMKVVLE
jgi:exopolyphosphatase/guanosine-5'-triphosphate,3'-diphosphate pyrophosphatase